MDFIRRGRGERYKTLDKHEGENLPDGMWEKCHGCRELIYVKDLDANWRVCPRCYYHHNLTVGRRVELLVDAGSWQETDHDLRPVDTLDFTIRGKHYAQRLPEAEASAGVPEAVISGRATLDGLPVVLAVMVIDFLGGTVGAVARALIGTNVALGILPFGTYMNIARAVGIPREDRAAAAQVIADGNVREIDVGEVAGQVFFEAAGIGLDALARLFRALDAADGGEAATQLAVLRQFVERRREALADLEAQLATLPTEPAQHAESLP